MIKESTLIIRVNNNMVKFYSQKFNNIKTDSIIEIQVTDLPKSSHTKITAVCDICKTERLMEYRTYINNTKNQSIEYYCKKCATKRIRETFITKYGVNHALQVKEFHDKAKKTLHDNFGVEVPFKNKKIRETFEDTMLKKYGVKNALQNDDIFNKITEKNYNKYGVFFYVQTEDFKNKSKKKCLEKYNKEFFMDTKQFRLKSIDTCLSKYDVKYPMQNENIFKKSFISSLKMKKYEGTELYYQGTYEKHFLDKCKQLLFLPLIDRGVSIKYNVDDNTYIYFPDFYLEKTNLIIEIKSTYWYNRHKEKNIYKEETCKKMGYDYLLILDKNYDNFYEKLNI